MDQTCKTFHGYEKYFPLYMFVSYYIRQINLAMFLNFKSGPPEYLYGRWGKGYWCLRRWLRTRLLTFKRPAASSASGTRPGNRPKRPLLQITYFIPQAGLDKCWIRVSSSVKSTLNIYLTTAVGILNDAHLSPQIRYILYQDYNQLVPFWRNLVSQDCGGGGLAMPWQSTLVVAGSPCTRHYPPPSPPPSPCPCSSGSTSTWRSPSCPHHTWQ